MAVSGSDRKKLNVGKYVVSVGLLQLLLFSTGGSEQGGNDVTLERRLQSGISDAIGGFFGARKQTGTATGNVFSLAGRGKVMLGWYLLLM